MAAQAKKTEDKTDKSTLKEESKSDAGNESSENKDAGSQQSQKPEPEKELISWKAPARPFKRRDKDFWVTVVSIATIFGLVLFIIEGAIPVILIISVVFLFYVMSTVAPEEVEYKITNKGVKIAGDRTDWQMITRFWFGERFNENLLIFETLSLSGRLELVIDPKDKDELKETLSEYLPEERASSSGMERAAGWLSKRLPSNN